MKLGTSGVRRVVGTVAVAAATAAGVAMVNPATASAEVVPPVVSYKVTRKRSGTDDHEQQHGHCPVVPGVCRQRRGFCCRA